MHKTRQICCALALLALARGAGADLWGFVDENGIAHLSDHQVDARYYLFRRAPPQPPAAAIAAPDPAPPLPVNRLLRRRYAPLIAAAAREFGIDPALLDAVIVAESGYDPQALSAKGAAGLMQLMPQTAARYAVKNVWDPRQNVVGGARYLRDLLALFNHDLVLTLAAYNAGERAVIQAGYRIPPFAETRDYVPRVLAQYERYRSRRPAGDGI